MYTNSPLEIYKVDYSVVETLLSSFVLLNIQVYFILIFRPKVIILGINFKKILLTFALYKLCLTKTISINFIVELLEFIKFDIVIIVVDLVSKTVYFISIHITITIKDIV